MRNSDSIVPNSTGATLNLQKDHEQLHCDLSAQPILDPDVIIHLDVNVDIDADLPENSALMMDSDLIVLDAVRDTATLLNSKRDHEHSHGDLSAQSILDPDVVIHSDVNVDIDAGRPKKSTSRTNSYFILTELNNAIRRETLGGPTADNMLFREMENRVVLSEDITLNAAEMFIDPVRSVG